MCRESDREREEREARKRERRGKERGRDLFLMPLFKFWELAAFEARNTLGYFSKLRQSNALFLEIVLKYNTRTEKCTQNQCII